ncbi:MAG: SsrA-binding protein SmpB [Planctomycetota bacterium]
MENRKVKHYYDILDTLEAGIELKGSEVKSIRTGNVSIVESFVFIKNMQAYVKNMNITPFQNSPLGKFEPNRIRRLLLHKYEIKRLYGKLQRGGLTVKVTKLYLKNGFVKLEIALVKPKKLYDRREKMKEEDIKRKISRFSKYKFK